MGRSSLEASATPELIARLEPHAASLEIHVDGGWITELTAEDIAAALGLIRGDSMPALVLRAKYGLEPMAGRRLMARLRGAAMLSYGLSLEQANRLAVLVWQAAILPAICGVCGGRREVLVEQLKIVCEGCQGTGVGKRSDGQLARALGASGREWRAIWEPKYCRLLETVMEWERRGIMHLVRALRD